MAKTFRLDSLSRAGAGVEVKFQFGDAPLPAGAGKSGMVVPDATALRALLEDPMLCFAILYLKWRALDPTGSNPGQMIGHSVTIDPTNTTSPVVIA